MSIAVITSLYGDLDELTDPPQMVGVDEYVAVTDRRRDVQRWDQVIRPRRHMSDRLASKIPKCLPHDYTSCDFVIWIDASAIVRDDLAEWSVGHLELTEAMVRDDLAEWSVGQLGPTDAIAQFVHPERDCIEDEAKVSAGMRKYTDLEVEKQAAHYLDDRGMPRHWGLWATGLMVRRRHAWSKLFGQAWLAEQVHWSYQDQISEPYVLWRMGQTRPVELDGSLWHDPHINFRGHRSDA